MKRYIVLLLAVVMLSCQSREVDKIILSEQEERMIFNMAKSYFQTLPEFEWNNLSEQEKNKIRLGKKLFYDTRLSQNKTQNCASCHIMEKFGQDNLRVSPGDSKQAGIRNVPSILNASLQYAQLWDAREKDVEAQSVRPVFGHKEMGMKDTLELIDRLSSVQSYQHLFNSAFEESDTIIGIENIKLALGSFVRTLRSPGRFDDYLKGDLKSLSSEEKLGLKGFVDQGCIPCHSGSLLGGQMEQKFALFGYYWDYTGSNYLDKGKYNESLNEKDKFVFKVPQLRNVAETAPYFHDGSVEKLEDCIRIMGQSELNQHLEDDEVQSILTFLNSLTGIIPEYAHEEGNFPFDQ